MTLLPPKSITDYTALLNAVKQEQLDEPDLYNTLMATENSVLQTINKSVENELKKREYESLYEYHTLTSLAVKTAATWTMIFRELFLYKTSSDIVEILTKGDRKIYVGIFIATIAFFLFLIELS
jgi:hypothetical protein